MIITFTGHRTLAETETLYKELVLALRASIPQSGTVSFYLGGYGMFDELCLRACREIKIEFPLCRICYVTPYYPQKTTHTELSHYDESIYPPLETVPPRFAIHRRNRWMVEQADLVIAYVKYQGGAFQMLEYARKKEKAILNLAQND